MSGPPGAHPAQASPQFAQAFGAAVARLAAQFGVSVLDVVVAPRDDALPPPRILRAAAEPQPPHAPPGVHRTPPPRPPPPPPRDAEPSPKRPRSESAPPQRFWGTVLTPAAAAAAASGAAHAQPPEHQPPPLAQYREPERPQNPGMPRRPSQGVYARAAEFARPRLTSAAATAAATAAAATAGATAHTAAAAAGADAGGGAALDVVGPDSPPRRASEPGLYGSVLPRHPPLPPPPLQQHESVRQVRHGHDAPHERADVPRQQEHRDQPGRAYGHDVVEEAEGPAGDVSPGGGQFGHGPGAPRGAGEALILNFPCAFCTSEFRRKSDMNRHVRVVHEKKRPFVCEICGNAFGEKSNKNKHVRMVHENQRHFKCPHCTATFGQRGNCDAHVRAVHEKTRTPRYACDTCGRSFTKKLALGAHVCEGDTGEAPPPQPSVQHPLQYAVPHLPPPPQPSYPSRYYGEAGPSSAVPATAGPSGIVHDGRASTLRPPQPHQQFPGPPPHFPSPLPHQRFPLPLAAGQQHAVPQPPLTPSPHHRAGPGPSHEPHLEYNPPLRPMHVQRSPPHGPQPHRAPPMHSPDAGGSTAPQYTYQYAGPQHAPPVALGSEVEGPGAPPAGLVALATVSVRHGGSSIPAVEQSPRQPPSHDAPLLQPLMHSSPPPQRQPAPLQSGQRSLQAQQQTRYPLDEPQVHHPVQGAVQDPRQLGQMHVSAQQVPRAADAPSPSQSQSQSRSQSQSLSQSQSQAQSPAERQAQSQAQAHSPAARQSLQQPSLRPQPRQPLPPPPHHRSTAPSPAQQQARSESPPRAERSRSRSRSRSPG